MNHLSIPNKVVLADVCLQKFVIATQTFFKGTRTKILKRTPQNMSSNFNKLACVSFSFYLSSCFYFRLLKSWCPYPRTIGVPSWTWIRATTKTPILHLTRLRQQVWTHGFLDLDKLALIWKLSLYLDKETKNKNNKTLNVLTWVKNFISFSMSHPCSSPHDNVGTNDHAGQWSPHREKGILVHTEVSISLFFCHSVTDG